MEYLTVNKTWIKKLGIIPAVILANYVQEKSDNDWFLLSHKKIMNQLNIKEYSISQAKKALISLGLIEIKREGIPSKEWIKINIKKLHEFTNQIQ